MGNSSERGCDLPQFSQTENNPRILNFTLYMDKFVPDDETNVRVMPNWPYVEARSQ